MPKREIVRFIFRSTTEREPYKVDTALPSALEYGEPYTRRCGAAKSVCRVSMSDLPSRSQRDPHKLIKSTRSPHPSLSTANQPYMKMWALPTPRSMSAPHSQTEL